MTTFSGSPGSESGNSCHPGITKTLHSSSMSYFFSPTSKPPSTPAPSGSGILCIGHQQQRLQDHMSFFTTRLIVKRKYGQQLPHNLSHLNSCCCYYYYYHYSLCWLTGQLFQCFFRTCHKYNQPQYCIFGNCCHRTLQAARHPSSHYPTNSNRAPHDTNITNKNWLNNLTSD